MRFEQPSTLLFGNNSGRFNFHQHIIPEQFIDLDQYAGRRVAGVDELIPDIS
jgi:hypothetical protein